MMTGNTLLKLALAAISLALLAAIGLATVVDVDRVVAAPEAGAGRAGRTLPSLATLAADDAVATILERPLFERSRRSPTPPVAAAAEAAAGPASEPPLPSRLAGVMITRFDAEALFAQDGRLVPVRLGDAINGWTVTTIEPERVILTSEFGERVLEPKPASTPRVAIAALARPGVGVPQPPPLPAQLAAALQGRLHPPAPPLPIASSPTSSKAAVATAPRAKGRPARQ
jgi:hypothetical protein